MYAVQKDIWHLTGRDKSIVEQLLRWSNNLFNVGTYEKVGDLWSKMNRIPQKPVS